jgi:EmrB/QacA subfamily drug resistance transporter
VSVTLADVQTTLHSGVTQLQWIVDGYLLAFAGLMLAGGTLGDLLGRKRVMLAGVALFCAGSLVAALAQTNSLLIAGRVIMGIGAAASEPGTLSLIRHLYPDERRRARALGAWTAVSGAALASGPVIGGLLVGGFGWRGVFWFNLVLGAVAFAGATAFLPESADPRGRRLDIPGLLLAAVALSAATFAVIEGENAGYRTWWIILLFAVGAVAALAFVAVERRSPDPALRLDVFRIASFSGANVAAFATSFGIFAVFFFTTLYLQLIASFSGWRIAVAFLAMAAAIVIAAPAAGLWTARKGPRQPLTIGCVLGGAGLVAVETVLKPNVSLAALVWALALAGAGFALALVAGNATVLAVVPPERSGMAASTVTASRLFGGIFGVAILGAIVNAQLTTSLAHKLAQLGIPPTFQGLVIHAVTHGGLPTSPASVQNPAAAGQQGLVAQVIAAAEEAFGRGLHLSLMVAAVMLFGAAVVAFLTVHAPPVPAAAARWRPRLSLR